MYYIIIQHNLVKRVMGQIFEIILPQAGLVVTASGVILFLARDVYDKRRQLVGFHPRPIFRYQLRYKSPLADRLRTLLRICAWAIFVFYLLVGLLLLELQIGILRSTGIEYDTLQQFVQIFHFIILVALSLILTLSMHVRGSPKHHAPPAVGPIPDGANDGDRNHGDQNE